MTRACRKQGKGIREAFEAFLSFLSVAECVESGERSESFETFGRNLGVGLCWAGGTEGRDSVSVEVEEEKAWEMGQQPKGISSGLDKFVLQT